jgi:LCP family protein required for cell wall assembly
MVILATLCGCVALLCVAAFEFTATSRIAIPETRSIDAAALAMTLQAAAPQETPDAEAGATPIAAATHAINAGSSTPMPATATDAGPSATPTASATPTPRPTPPPPAANLPWPQTLNIVLLGSDRRPGDGSWRTDTIIIVAIDPQSKQVGVIAVPRDMWINVPSYANRVNTLDFVGGPQFVKDALQYTFGIPIHYYMRINFGGFVQAVDAVGGITVDVQCGIFEAGGELGTVNIPSGSTQMDGAMALTFARSRLTTTDYDRMRRQQAVLLAFRKKLLSPDVLPRLPELVSAMSKLTETDIPPQTLLSIARLGAEIDMKNVHGFLLDERVMRGVPNTAGASIIAPDPQTLKNGLDNLWTGEPLTEAIKRPKNWSCN